MIINSVVAQAINKAIKEIRVEHLIRRLRDGAWETYFTMLLADKLEDELEAIGEENKVRLSIPFPERKKRQNSSLHGQYATTTDNSQNDFNSLC